jgi:iron complex outermembrane receptor protein
MKSTIGFLIFSSAISTLTASYPAFAQAVDASSSSEIQTVVVTAQKRSESVQDIPVSVTVVSGDSLTQSGVKDLVQAATLIPGVVFSRAPDDGLALTFRGLGTAARSQAFELSEAMFVDGTFMGKGRLYTTSIFDVERMEFIKGTESTFLGKNASLGAVSVITRQPGDKSSFEGNAGYQFEHGGGYTADAAGDLPLSDKVSLRLAGHYNDLDGWVHNDFTDHWGPEQKDLGLRATLRANLTDALTVTGSYQYSDNKRIGASYQLVGNIPPAYGEGLLNDQTDQFTAATLNGDTLHDTASHLASLKGELKIGDHTLISQTSYVRYKLSFIDDLDFSKDNAINFLRDETYHQFTQELRMQSPSGGALEYMGGLFYLDSHWDSLERQQWAVPAFPPPPAPISGQLFNGPFANKYLQDSKSYSAFASGTWHITEALRLAGGIRGTRETKDVLFGRTNSAPFTIWNTIANPPFDPTPLALRSNFLDGNVSLQYNFTPNAMAYATFGHGSKAGGFAETNTIAIPPTLLVNGKVPPALVAGGSQVLDEFAKSYEIGIKTTLFDRRMFFNIAGFWTDVKNFQDTVFTGGPLGFITFNGPARSRGVEVATAFTVTPKFRVDGGLTYADATGVIQPIDPVTMAPEVDANGNPVYANYTRSQAPKVIFNLNGHYATPLTNSLGLRLGASVRHRSMMFNQRQELFPSDALTTVDLLVGIASTIDRWGIELAAKNVLNKISEDFASPSVDPRFGAFYGAYLAGPTPTRTITLSATVKY